MDRLVPSTSTRTYVQMLPITAPSAFYYRKRIEMANFYWLLVNSHSYFKKFQPA